MEANKIILNNKTLIDLTADTVTQNDVKKGATFHGCDGVKYTGTYEGIIPDGNEHITANTAEGESIDVAGKATVTVAVPIPEGYVKPTGTKEITENGTEIDVGEYAYVDVNVPIPDGYVIPEGNLHITANTVEDESIDVSDKKSVTVAIPVPALEGTAIPIHRKVQQIYFNTGLTEEETKSYLSQLTYVQTDLSEAPVYIVYAERDTSVEVWGLIIMADVDNNEYYIRVIRGEIGGTKPLSNATVFSSRGWRQNIEDNGDSGDIDGCMHSVFTYGGSTTPISDFNGIPIGTENETIKNVISSTPFAENVVDNPLPVEISTEAEMNALLENGEVGAIYKYVGDTTDTYESGSLYVIEVSDDV